MGLKVVVTGADGMLGRELCTMHLPGINIVPLSREKLDITDSLQCLRVVEQIRPDVIIHTAAYTAVDLAEYDAEAAFRTNGDGTRNVAVAAAAVNAKLCYISTDYVFDGKGAEPYATYAPTHPLSIYGKSKLAGESHVREVLERFFIVRTSWVFGRYGHNFVKTIVRLARERESLRIVNDQIGSPTYAYDLACFLIELVQSDRYGIYHASNSGSCSWYTFAQAIIKYCNTSVEVMPCSTDEFPRPAPRPVYSVLDCSAMAENGFRAMRPWQEALRHYFEHGVSEEE